MKVTIASPIFYEPTASAYFMRAPLDFKPFVDPPNCTIFIHGINALSSTVSQIHKTIHKPHREFLVGGGRSSTACSSITVARSRAHSSSDKG